MLPNALTIRGSNSTLDNASAVVQFLVSGISGDYLVCKTLSGTTSGTNYIYVAKPYLLRRTNMSGATRNGVTYTYSGNQSRDATTGGTSINEKVTPSYQAGDVVYGVGPVDGEIGELGILFVDMNLDGRSWAKVT